METVSNYQEYTDQALANFVKKDAKSRYLLVNAVKGEKVERVLDVGCGAGQELFPFIEKTDAFCVGVDAAAELGKVTQKVFQQTDGENRTAFVRSFGESLPFSDASFDVVLCRVAIPYMNNRAIIAEVARILRPNGIFLLKTHAPAFYFGMIRERFGTFSLKQIAYPLICLTGSIVHSLSGRQMQNGFWKGKEIFQTQGFIERECRRNNLYIKGFLSDTNPETPSFVIIKN